MYKIISILVTINLFFMGHAHAGNIEAGRAISTSCSACHGTTGLSNSEQFPNIAGQKESYIIKTLQDYRSGARKDLTMQAIVGPLNDQIFEDLAAYYSSQTPIATFSSETGDILIPYVEMDGVLFKLNMGQLNPGNMVFKITYSEQL